MSTSSLLYRAAFVASMDRPMIGDGGVIVNGDRIVAVGRFSDLDCSRSEARDLGDVVLLPGLVNAHAHLELSLMTCEPRGGASFVDWLNSVRKRNTHDVADAVRAGVQQCNRFGVTTIGDISQQALDTRTALRAIENRPVVVSYAEVLGLGKRRARFDELFERASDISFPFSGISPHSPYTVDQAGYEQCLRAARERDLPFATHLAEHPAEKDFLESHAGTFRDLWDQLGSWDESVETFHGSPIEFAKAIGLLDYPTLLAHVNYCDDHELKLLARGEASIVYCPRTHRYFGHPPHRWREMLAAGVNVALGTDSCASSPDLNLLEELRLLHEIAPDFPIESIWEIGTIRGAQALRLQTEVGSIAPGKRADLICFDVKSEDPLREILESKSLPRMLMTSPD